MNIREELDRIRVRHRGLLRPRDVVAAAEPKNSLLHGCFDWDDSSAAHKFRLEQARHLIRVFVQVSKCGRKNIESRVYVALGSESEGGGGYRLLTDVLSDKAMREELLQEAYRDMRYFMEKYSALKELASVFQAIREISGRKGMSSPGLARRG